MSAKAWDVLVKGALLFDGSGTYPVYRDIAIADGVIANIGPQLDCNAAEETVDASGCWLIPGMLDIHTHLDLEVEVNPGLGECVQHGTTTVVVGNCSLGTAFGTQRKDGSDPIIDCFARVESMPKSVLSKCVDKITWDNTLDYLKHFETIPLGPNIVPLIPHSMLRIEAMGLQAAATRRADPSELARMQQLLHSAMEQGYAGLSLDSLAFHYLAIDPNKERRIPTQVADRKEIFPLANIVREHDRVLQTTPDNNDSWNSLVRLFWSCGRLYKKPLKISALVAIDFNPIPFAYKLMLALASFINSRLLRGNFHFQALSTNFRMWSNGLECPIFEELPSTREWVACEVEDKIARQKLLSDPKWIQRFRDDMDRVSPKHTFFEKLKRGRPPTFSLVAEDMKIEITPDNVWNGDTLADVLARLHQYQRSEGKDGAKNNLEEKLFSNIPQSVEDSVDLFLYCLRKYDIEFRWRIDIANCRPDVVKEMLFNEHTLPGFNDSGAHITNMAFYDANLCTLRIAQAESLQKVAIAVRRLTRDPAAFFDVDAGEIKIGARADLVLIDPTKLANYDTNANRAFVHVPHYDAKCMVNRSDGVVKQVYINGKRVWESGHGYTDVLGKEVLGHVLRSGHSGIKQKSGYQSALS